MHNGPTFKLDFFPLAGQCFLAGQGGKQPKGENALVQSIRRWERGGAGQQGKRKGGGSCSLQNSYITQEKGGKREGIQMGSNGRVNA